MASRLEIFIHSKNKSHTYEEALDFVLKFSTACKVNGQNVSPELRRTPNTWEVRPPRKQLQKRLHRGDFKDNFERKSPEGNENNLEQEIEEFEKYECNQPRKAVESIE